MLSRTKPSTSDTQEFERAIEAAADAHDISVSWHELWDEEEAVRALRLFALHEFKPSPDPRLREREVSTFVAAHATFFYTSKARNEPDRARAITLWPHVHDMERLWVEKKGEDYHCAAKAMATILRKAKLDVPVY